MLRKGTEQKNAMDMVVFVYLVDCGKKLILRNVSRKKDFFACYTKCFAAFSCTFFIGNVAWVLSYANDAQSWICLLYTSRCV